MEEYNRRVMAAIKSKKGFSALQIMFGWMWLIAMLPMVSGVPRFMSTFMLGLLVLAFLCIRSGHTNRKLAKLADSYWLRIQTDPARSIDNLAASLGQSPVKVRKNVQGMIKRRIFPEAYLNGNLLILPVSVSSTGDTEPTKAAATSAPQAVVACRNCGATNIGQKKACEYCGSPL